MKRIIFLLIVIILFSLMLSSCSTQCEYLFVESKSNIKVIEIINIIDYVDIFNEAYDSFEVIATIDSDLEEVFLKDFSNIPCYQYYGDRIEHIDGYTIRITYNDNSYELIGKETVYYEKEDGHGKFSPYHFNKDAFASFITKYVTN